jgi:hypothetical protein
MSVTDFCFGFRIAGGVHCERKRVHAATAFDAYRLCDPRAHVDEESYLSAFDFDQAFQDHLGRIGTTRGFSGSTWSPYIWFDIDREASGGGIEQALIDTRRLVDVLVEHHAVPLESLLSFFSGSKGFHLGCPTAFWRPTGSVTFHRTARSFAEGIAQVANIVIDVSIYDRVRAFRAPNSRHGKTGLHKRFLPPEQLGTLTIDDIVELARTPGRFQLPDIANQEAIPSLAAAWEVAEQAVAAQDAAAALRQEQVAGDRSASKLNRITMEIIRGEPITVGDRHRLIYSAARNLAEAGATLQLTQELLVEPARNAGLPPRDVERQIRCGFSDGAPPIGSGGALP